MTITPFLTLNLRKKRDALSARQKARRVARLLGYSPHEQACIAAGTFLVAHQALMLLGRARLSFRIENREIHVFAEPVKIESAEPRLPPNRVSELFREPEAKGLMRLSKPLPPEQTLEEQDLGWLVQQVDVAATPQLFDEIIQQNQEILTLLHELRLCRVHVSELEEKTRNPHAA